MDRRLLGGARRDVHRALHDYIVVQRIAIGKTNIVIFFVWDFVLISKPFMQLKYVSGFVAGGAICLGVLVSGYNIFKSNSRKNHEVWSV